MAQLRQDFTKFQAEDTVVIVVGPEDAGSFKEYWQTHKPHFTGLPDPTHNDLELYGQEVNLFKPGRMPAMVIVDKQGSARYVHYGHVMSDIPKNEEVLLTLQELNQEALQRRTA